MKNSCINPARIIQYWKLPVLSFSQTYFPAAILIAYSSYLIPSYQIRSRQLNTLPVYISYICYYIYLLYQDCESDVLLFVVVTIFMTNVPCGVYLYPNMSIISAKLRITRTCLQYHDNGQSDHKNMLMISGLWTKGSQEHAYDIRTMDKRITRTCL